MPRPILHLLLAAAVLTSGCSSKQPSAEAQEAPDPLTEREAVVLDLIANGQSNRQIAAALNLAEGTVKNHASRIMQKLHANTRTELAVLVLARRKQP